MYFSYDVRSDAFYVKQLVIFDLQSKLPSNKLQAVTVIRIIKVTF